MKLWLIRHAKSDWDDPRLSDFQRPLNARGRRDGPRMQAWLAQEPHPASWIWCSDAERARATAAFVAAAWQAVAPQLVLEHRLYLADPDTLLDVLRGTPAEVTEAALVAHNPGLTELVNRLAGEPVTDNLPTFGVARFDVPAQWVDLRPGSARLERLTSPKRLPGAA